MLSVSIGCAPAPKYRSHRGTGAISYDESGPPESGMPSDLGIKLHPPVEGFSTARITSPFGIRPSGRRHDGVDIKARPGEKVLAAAPGTVSFSGSKRGYGNVVIIDHGGGISTLYAHLFHASVRRGEGIRAGEIVGRAGNRGRATGTHLHFEVRIGGSPVDPMPYLWLDSSGE